MAQALTLTPREKNLVARIRMLPPERVAEIERYVTALGRSNPVTLPDPAKAKHFGEPGAPPIWHIEPEEERDMEEFLKRCEGEAFRE